MNYFTLYQIIYALAAKDGRDEALFGSCFPLSSEAFYHSTAGTEFPELWFEVPLLGDPWFDLHALTSQKDLDPNMSFTAETTGGYPQVFKWFAGAPNVRQLALSYDVSSGDISKPAVQLLLATTSVETTCAFLEAAGRSDAVAAYQSFYNRLPGDWFACYSGTFPARPKLIQDGADSSEHLAEQDAKPWVRVECIPDRSTQEAYAKDGALLESHLRQVGLTNLGTTIIDRCQALARTPFQLEFQFDVGPDGKAGTTLGVSVRFAEPSAHCDNWQSFEADGAAGELMNQVQAWGLCDERWRLLQDAAFSKRVSRNGKAMLAYCLPTFLKLRWRGGEPLDAKAYLIAGIQDVELENAQ